MTDHLTRKQPKELFYSYSHKDEKLRDELETHLSILKRHGIITGWHDRMIGAGEDWEGQIDKHLNAAMIILLLISPDFLASNYCYDVEMKRALARHESGEAQVVPIILRPCDWKGAPFGRLQCLPKDAKAITRWQNRDEAFENIAKGIRRAVEELETLEKISATSLNQPDNNPMILQIGTFTVPDVVPEFMFVSKNSPPLTSGDIRCEYEEITTPLPSEIEDIRIKYVAQKELEAKQGNKTLNNNDGYSLHSLRVDREQDKLGGRHRVFTLRLRPTDYYHGTVFPNNALDESIEVAGIPTTARKVLGLWQDRLRFENLLDFSCHFPIFTATVFITKDNKVVIPIRSKSQFIAGGNTYHLSAAEGMLRPKDVDESSREPSPFITATRSLIDELGLTCGVDFEIDDLRCLGLLLDTLRAHPFCIFYARSSTILFNDVRKKWLQAKDRFEAQEIVGMEWNEQTALRLIQGSFEYKGARITIASNHALSGWLLAALFDFGEERL